MKKQKKLLRWVGIFFAVMLVLTFLSRAADSLSIAQVTLAKPQNQAVVHTVTGTGKVEGTKERAVFAPAGKRISQVLVKEGQSVKKGDTLLILSAGDLKKAVTEKEDEVSQLSGKVQDLASGNAVQDQKDQSTLQRAREDVNTAVHNGDASVADAQRELDAARQKLSDHDNASQQFTDGGEDNSERQALLDDIRSKEENLNQVIRSRNKDVTDANRALEDALQPKASDSSLTDAETQLARSQEELEELQKLVKRKGAVKASADGVGKSVSVQTGSQTTEDAAVVLYETKGKLYLTGTIPKEDAKYAEAGIHVTVTDSSGKEIQGECTLVSISDNNEDPALKNAVIEIPEDSMVFGSSGEFTIEKESGPYDCCVPLTAIHEENNSTFVYVEDTENSVYGTVFVARKVTVNVQDKNETLAALKNGALSSKQKVVTDSDREIIDGSRIRVAEDS